MHKLCRYSGDANWGVLDRSAHWHNLANTIELSVCGGEAALCHITLTTCCTQQWTFASQNSSSVHSYTKP